MSTRPWILTSIFETFWGQYGLQSLILVHSHANIIFQLHFSTWNTLEAIISYTWFCSISQEFYISSSDLNTYLRQEILYYGPGVVIAISQGNFHIKDNGLKFTNSWEFTNLSKSAEFHLNRCADFISSPTFWNRTDYESWQNFGSFSALHVSVV